MKKIYLVFESGAGIIHQAFYLIIDAQVRLEELQKETGMDCFEILSVDIS